MLKQYLLSMLALP